MYAHVKRFAKAIAKKLSLTILKASVMRVTREEIKNLPADCERDREIKAVALKMFDAVYPKELKEAAEFKLTIRYENSIMNLTGDIPKSKLAPSRRSVAKYY